MCESLANGTRVVVAGRLRQRTFEVKDGSKRTVLEVEADDVSVSLKFATCKVTKATRSRTESSGGGEADPRATESPSSYSDEPPF